MPDGQGKIDCVLESTELARKCQKDVKIGFLLRSDYFELYLILNWSQPKRIDVFPVLQQIFF